MVVPTQHVPTTRPPERIAIVDVRLQDFRGFDDCCVALGTQTLLVGENNSGKSTFLRGLEIALGGAQVREEDFRISKGVQTKEFVIDVRVEPTNGTNFDASTTQSLGTAVQPGKSGTKSFFTLRARGAIDPSDGPVLRRCFLRGWAPDRAAAAKLQELSTPAVSSKHRDLVTFTLLDARRDIASELRNRRTYWGRLLSDLQLPPQTRTDLETKLKDAGEALVTTSGRLTSIQNALRELATVLSRPDASVHLSTVPSNVDDLVRYVDVLVGEISEGPLSVQQQGMGTRSLLAIMLFETFVHEVLKTSATYTLPVTGIEEPEAHVHPHAQRALLGQFEKLPGQVLISTHSPFVASVADIFSVRLFRKEKPGNTVRWARRFDATGQPRIDNEGVSLLQRFVQRRNGEILFCRVAALFEGDTEEAALPLFAEQMLQTGASAAGVSLVNVAGAGNYKHFLPLLEDLGIPWVILSDADPAGIAGIAAAGKAIGRTLNQGSAEVVCYAGANDFEAQLLADGLQSEAEQAIANFYGPTALADFKTQLHGTQMRGGGLRDYASTGWEARLLHDFLDKHKGSFGASFAREVVTAGKQMPHVSAYFSKIKGLL